VGILVMFLSSNLERNRPKCIHKENSAMMHKHQHYVTNSSTHCVFVVMAEITYFMSK